MDPITAAIVTALSAGAAVVAKEAVTQTTKDAYAALKGWIQQRYSDISVDQVEKQPTSKARQEVLGEDLVRAGAPQDEQLLKLAKVLTERLRAEATADSGRPIGVDVGELDQANATFGNVLAGKGATGVKITKVSGGSLHFGDVTATSESEQPKKA